MLGEGCEHLVKRLSEGGEDLPGKNIKPRGDARRFQTRDLDSIRIEFGRNSMRISSEKGFDLGFEIINFGFGPFDLGEATEKRRFRFHDIESIMAEDDDLKATKISWALSYGCSRMGQGPNRSKQMIRTATYVNGNVQANTKGSGEIVGTQGRA
jgi:hypothetical protein